MTWLPSTYMTTEEEIEQALDDGDVERAALLAARLPKPAAYLAAMLKINEIVAAGMKEKNG